MPCLLQEVLPGDTFDLSSTAFARLATPLKPIMDNIYLDFQFFFVPNRLVWENWERFMGERDNPDDDPSLYTVPKVGVPAGGYPTGSIYDYFGLPTLVHFDLVSDDDRPNALPLRAYNLIYNEWYRDQNLIDSVDVPKGDGPDLATYQLLRRAKRHDYFTSALPWPQKGDAVSIPIGDAAPIVGLGVKTTGAAPETGTFTQSDGTTFTSADGTLLSSSNLGFLSQDITTPYTPDIFADLQSATAITINELRTAFQIQKLLERDARGS